MQVLRQRHNNSTAWARTLPLGLSLAVSAIFMALAIEAPEHFWLGWITLLPLMQSARVLSPAAALGAGALWGGCVFSAAAVMGSRSIELTASSLAILTMGPSLYAAFGAWLTRRVGFSPYLMALGWVGVEFCLRPVGLDHGLLAGTQGDGMLLRVAGSFAGYFLVAFVVAYINASLLSVLHQVTGSCSSLVRESTASGLVGRLFVVDVPYIPSRVLCVSQPRAPPAL